LKNVGAVGVEFLAFPLTWHIAYTAACCYRTSHNVYWLAWWRHRGRLQYMAARFLRGFRRSSISKVNSSVLAKRWALILL